MVHSQIRKGALNAKIAKPVLTASKRGINVYFVRQDPLPPKRKVVSVLNAQRANIKPTRVLPVV